MSAPAKAAALPSLGRAVVVGGSLAGSCVAAALAPYHENVLVVERDDLPREPRHRKGLPHGQLVRSKDWMSDETVRHRVETGWDRLGAMIGA